MQRNRLLIAVAVVIGLVGVGLYALGRDDGASSPPPPTGTVAAITLPGQAVTTPDDARDDARDETESGGSAAGESQQADTPIDTGLPDGCEPVGGYDTVALSQLPPEAYDTLAVIDDGPPYPFRADGGIFQNREGHLPDRERGYYLEFTVITPGSSDRGARRIVTGECGEFWYTDDHYDSFALVDIDR